MKIRKTSKTGPKSWMVDLGKVEGRRQRFFFETKVQAQRFLEAKLLERENLGIQALTLSHEARSEYLTVKAKLEDNGVSLLEAVDFYLSHGVKCHPCTIAQVVAECLASKEAAGRRKRYLQELRCCLRSFSLGREESLCSSISAREVEAWLNGQGWRMTTCAGYLQNLRTLFSFARARGYCLKNPAEAVEKPMPEVITPRVLSLPEVRALLRAGLAIDAAFVGGYIALILFGGLRSVESSRISIEDVRVEVIRVLPEKSKTRQRRDIERSGLLNAWMAYCSTWPLKNVRRRLIALRAAAARELFGLDSQEAFPWPPNCLRHSFCSYALPVLGARSTAEAAGHSEEVLFSRYREVVGRREAEEFWLLTPSIILGTVLDRRKV